MFNLDNFIDTFVTKRVGSMFEGDIDSHKNELSAAIKEKTVLVIGGAGSIGSSFIKAILPFHPSELCIVDINENALTELTRDLRSSGSFVPDIYLSYPMDYSSVAFQRFFRQHGGFDIVANFSAHKHVRSEKDIYSVEALLRNNVLNARKLLDLLEEYRPSAYFCVSTDKAADPVNIMGASKRIMEDLIFSYSSSFPVKTARFANVAFSNGSLPAGFLERIARLQPLSAPSDVKRYFVSPKEAGQICMLAAVLGENRAIFFPKLNEEQMETFDSIARELLKAYGYQTLECSCDEEAVERAKVMRANGGRGSVYPVHFSLSNTSGEKTFEEFYTDLETVELDRFLSLGVITGKVIPDKSEVFGLMTSLEAVFEKPSVTKADIVEIISSYLPDFNHIETGRTLDEKM